MKKILFLIVALGSMLTCLFYAFDSSFFQNNEVEKKEIEEPKHQLIYDADYDFSEPLKVITLARGYRDTVLVSPNEIICKLNNDSLQINFDAGFMTGISFNTSIINDTSFTNTVKYSCLGNDDYETTESKMILEKKDFVLRDSLKIHFDMLFIHRDSYVLIKGASTIAVRDERFTINMRMYEDQVADFYFKSKNRPDTIKSLDLRGFMLDTIPNELQLFTNLVKLDLEYNRIPPSEFRKITHLQKLEHLNLRGNKLKEFPKSLLKLKNLKRLDLWNNSISTEELNKQMKKLPNLED